MFRSIFLNLTILFIQFVTLQSQSINNVKLLFHEENTAIYECAASPVGSTVSFRTSAGDVDMHYIYDFKAQAPVPIFVSDDSFLTVNQIQRNTNNLIWSAVDAKNCLLKVVEDGKTYFAEVMVKEGIQIVVRYYDATNLNPSQYTTSTFLAYYKKKEGQVLLSHFSPEGDESLDGKDIPASRYDLYFLKPQSDPPKTMALPKNPNVRELHASAMKKYEFILSGVDDTGMNELYHIDMRDYSRLTTTPHLSESWPAVSPNDEFVVFCHPHGKNENTADLFIMPTSGGTPEVLATNIYIPVTSYSSSGIYQWTKDGKGIVFISYNPDRKNPLAIVDIQSKQISLFDIDIVFPSSFAITGDGKHILIVAAGTSASNEQTSYKAFVGEYNH